MKISAEKQAKSKYSRVKRQTDHGQTELSVLNEINKEGTFAQGFKN